MNISDPSTRLKSAIDWISGMTHPKIYVPNKYNTTLEQLLKILEPFTIYGFQKRILEFIKSQPCNECQTEFEKLLFIQNYYLGPRGDDSIYSSSQEDVGEPNCYLCGPCLLKALHMYEGD